MPANATPNFTKNGVIGSVLVTAANTSSAGGGTVATNIFLVATSDATNGTFIDYVRVNAVATTPTSTTATVGRIFASSVVSGSTTSADTILLAEVALPVTTADNATTAVNNLDVALNFRLPAGWTILCTTHAAPATNTNWRFTAIGGDY